MFMIVGGTVFLYTICIYRIVLIQFIRLVVYEMFDDFAKMGT